VAAEVTASLAGPQAVSGDSNGIDAHGLDRFGLVSLIEWEDGTTPTNLK